MKGEFEMTADGELKAALAEAGNDFGFDTVDAQFVAFKDFRVGDWLADAPGK
ncbi:MAG: hypothetical protein PWR17_594 [Candidatus Methanomethylophilaceae archaeon]|nr:hypothetical protein [Candidatus Methanomethylophilaceae archaeon]